VGGVTDVTGRRRGGGMRGVRGGVGWRRPPGLQFHHPRCHAHARTANTRGVPASGHVGRPLSAAVTHAGQVPSDPFLRCVRDPLPLALAVAAARGDTCHLGEPNPAVPDSAARTAATVQYSTPGGRAAAGTP
jgi:hypothetical protein